jgi:hypothetical protein
MFQRILIVSFAAAMALCTSAGASAQSTAQAGPAPNNGGAKCGTLIECANKALKA